MRGRAARNWARWTNVLLLILVTGGLVWTLLAGDREAASYWATGEWLLVGAWVVPRSTPDTAAWALALIVVGCAAAALGLFCVYQWVGWPLVAYVEAGTFGAFALQATLWLFVKRFRLRPGPENTAGTGEHG
jgi:hypothetical protein